MTEVLSNSNAAAVVVSSSSIPTASNEVGSAGSHHNKNDSLTMGMERVHYQCERKTAAAPAPQMADGIDQQMTMAGMTPNSPRHHPHHHTPVKSPRCEAFVMTGEKMLSLNPKISPCYAKVCQDQLPPAVEVEEKAGTTPKQHHAHNPFDDFPSMHKNGGGRKRVQSASTSSAAEREATLAYQQQHQQGQQFNSSMIPESLSENIIATATADQGQNSSGGGLLQEKSSQELENLSLDDNAIIDTGANMVPSDPSISNNSKRHNHNMNTTLSTTTLPGQQISAANIDDEMQDQNINKFLFPSSNAHHQQMDTATTISRFMASHHQSQSVPVSPARLFQHNGQQQQQQELTPQFVQQQQHGMMPQHSYQQQQHKDKFSSSNRSSSTADAAIMQSVYSPETIARLAKHLFTHQEGGIKIAAFLVKSDDLSLQIARQFVHLFNFAGIRVDAALRNFLSHVYLTGVQTTGDQRQLLSHFAQRYHECNPTVFNCAEQVQVLTCALLLLNTELHGGKQTTPKITCREFVDNLARTEHKFDASMLKELYAAVNDQPLYKSINSNDTNSVQFSAEKRLSRVLSSSNKKKSSSSVISTHHMNNNALINPEQQINYKNGWLKKKSLYDSDGKKTPMGRRKWQLFYATIRGMVLYLHSNESGFSGSRYIAFKNCILLHHSIAEVPRHYVKRKNVFLLRTANWGEVLFQTSSPAELQTWMEAINYVAAAFSTPALPTPVGASGAVTFHRPNLPSAPTHLPISDQTVRWKQRMEETAENLARLRDNAPPIKAKGKPVYDYFYKERFLDKERERYSVYVSILREKLSKSTASSSSALLCSENQQQQSTSNSALLGSSSGTNTNKHQQQQKDANGAIDRK